MFHLGTYAHLEKENATTWCSGETKCSSVSRVLLKEELENWTLNPGQSRSFHGAWLGLAAKPLHLPTMARLAEAPPHLAECLRDSLRDAEKINRHEVWGRGFDHRRNEVIIRFG